MQGLKCFFRKVIMILDNLVFLGEMLPTLWEARTTPSASDKGAIAMVFTNGLPSVSQRDKQLSVGLIMTSIAAIYQARTLCQVFCDAFDISSKL